MSPAVSPASSIPAPLRGEAAPGRGPLILSPEQPTSAAQLAAWIQEHHPWVLEARRRHGALMFRGFELSEASDFERVARTIDPELANRYLGTSPREALTDYVFTASELPGYYPIPQHCEMSFVAEPPRSLFFWCAVQPAAGSGETPLCDFRAVAEDLQPEVKARFRERGVTIIRNYAGPESGGGFDLWKLKRWDEMFGTTDREEVERQCAEQAFEPTWFGKDGLRLVSHQPAFRPHPDSGEEAWFNHSQVFHLSAGPGEYRRITALRPKTRHFAVRALASGMATVKRWTTPDEQLALQCTYGDGSPIPDADMEAVRDAIWQNLRILPWTKGDMMAIDNFSCSHGRMPYSGPREIAVAWA